MKIYLISCFILFTINLILKFIIDRKINKRKNGIDNSYQNEYTYSENNDVLFIKYNNILRQKQEDFRIDCYIREQAMNLSEHSKFNLHSLFVKIPYSVGLYKIYDKESAKYKDSLDLEKLIKEEYNKIKN